MLSETFKNLPKEKQDRILSVAQTEFANYGFDLASIQRIVKAANISRGSFYQYFRDKTDIFTAFLVKLGNFKYFNL